MYRLFLLEIYLPAVVAIINNNYVSAFEALV